MPVQAVQPVQQTINTPSLQIQLKNLFTVVFEEKEISEYELMDLHGYDDLGELRKLLQVLARDNLIYNLRPGVWGVV